MTLPYLRRRNRPHHTSDSLPHMPTFLLWIFHIALLPCWLMKVQVLFQAALPFQLIQVAKAQQQQRQQQQEDGSLDYYCGTDWADAFETCPKHCPSGEDQECIDELGEEYKCWYFTGCHDKIMNGEFDGNGDSGGSSGGGDNQELINNNFCGTSWIQAMLSCNEPCPLGTECTDPEERCFAATNCDKPLMEIISDLLITLAGPDSTMDGTEGGVFEGTMLDILREVAEAEGIALDGVGLMEQSVLGRRELEERGRERRRGLGIRMAVSNVTQRILPSGSSALDVSMVVTGDYRPPPYLDLNVIAEDSINRQGEKVVSTLRERGGRAGVDFFERVEGIEAMAKEKVTARPTTSPTIRPTQSPTTGAPSLMPSSEPSGKWVFNSLLCRIKWSIVESIRFELVFTLFHFYPNVM